MANGKRTAVEARRSDPADPIDGNVEELRWHELVSQVGVEIAEPLTAALERIHTLTATGKIDRAGLRALRDEVERARQAGMIGQQLTRFASGKVKQSHEVLQLEEVLKSVLALRTRETQARGIALKHEMKSARIIVDGSLLFSLLNATLDWALANAHAHIAFAVDFKTWPVHARLTCRFANRPADQVDETVTTEDSPRLDSLTWRLIEQTAWTMGLVLERKDVAGATTLLLEFPKTAGEEMAGLSATEIDDAGTQSTNSKALAGSHVLVVASRREVRVLIRDALRNMSMLIDFVASIDEAASFCREGLPHAIIVDSILKGSRFTHFRDEILGEVPDFVFIEILEQGSTFEMSGTNGAQMARIGRDVVASSLPAALMFELSRGL
jgi:CheY-like chemotaxis protein